MKQKLQSLATTLCAVGMLLGVACWMCARQWWFDWYPAIVAMCWLMEMVVATIIDKHKGDEHKLMTALLVAKAVKMAVTLTIVGLYIATNNDHKVEFALTAVAVYVANLMAETYVVTKYR